MFTDSDNFGVNFPIDLDVKVWYQLTYNMIDYLFQVKATLLGATFLIDFMYFEKQSNNWFSTQILIIFL